MHITTGTPVENSVQIYDLETVADGVGGKVAVRWDQIPDETFFVSMYEKYRLSSFCTDLYSSEIIDLISLRNELDTVKSSYVSKTNGFVSDAYYDTQLQRHVRGDSEYLGDTSYVNANRGVAAYHKAEFRQKVKRIKPGIYKEGGYTGSIEVYKGSSLDPDKTSHVLLFSLTENSAGVYLSQVITELSEINFPSSVTLEENEYLYVFFENPSNLIVWNAQSGSEPTRPDQFIFEGVLGWQLSSPGFRYGAPLWVENELITEGKKVFLGNPRINVPDTLYAVVDIPFSLYYDGCVLGVDKGLQSPLNWSVEVLCSVGKMQERRFTVTPLAGDIGSHDLEISVFNHNHDKIAYKKVTLTIVDNSAPISDNENIIVLGDSLTFGGEIVDQMIANFTSLGSNTPLFIGSVDTGNGSHEGHGGWGWEDFSGAGSNYFRFDVSGITQPPAINAVYTSNGNNFTVREVNLSGSSGYIKCIRSSGSGNPSTAPNNLTKISGTGDAVITYSAWELEPANPFWNSGTGQLDMTNYKTVQGITGDIKVMTIQLGINDVPKDHYITTEELDGIITNANTFLDFVLAAEVNCKIVIVLTTTDGNTLGGYSTNYGATQSKQIYQSNIWSLRERYVAEYGNGAYDADVDVCIASIDRYYGYERQTVSPQVYSEYANSQEYHINARHPGSGGYKEIGDHLFSRILPLLH